MGLVKTQVMRLMKRYQQWFAMDIAKWVQMEEMIEAHSIKKSSNFDFNFSFNFERDTASWAKQEMITRNSFSFM